MNQPASPPARPKPLQLLTPQFLMVKLKQHPLTRGLYPTAVGYYPNASGYKMEENELPDNLLLYCTDGRGHLQTDGEQRPVGNGDLVFLPAGEIHTLGADSADPWSMYWVRFTGELAEDFGERFLMKMDRGLAFVGHQPRVIADFETLLELGDHGYTATNVIHRVHLLQQVLSFLALQLRLHHPPGRKELDIELLEAIMMERLHRELDLDTLAERASMSKYHFSRKFRALTGASPIQYFINMKMQHACLLLETTGRSVKQIGAGLGYEDPYYFSRLFKKVVGESPTRFRKRYPPAKTH